MYSKCLETEFVRNPDLRVSSFNKFTVIEGESESFLCVLQCLGLPKQKGESPKQSSDSLPTEQTQSKVLRLLREERSLSQSPPRQDDGENI